MPAYAFTDYKIQGQWLDNVVIDLESCRTLQSAYVMLSRCRSMKGLAILRWFDPIRIYRPLSQQFREEFTRLHRLDTVTKSEYENRRLDMMDC
jgi:hypothetical protein